MTSPDYYLLDELLTDEARAVRDRVRAFVDSDLLPVINDYWDRAEFPWPLVPKLAGLGLAGYTIEGYGCPGLSPLELGMVTLELARGDGSITTFMSVQSGLTMGTINLLGARNRNNGGCRGWRRWTRSAPSPSPSRTTDRTPSRWRPPCAATATPGCSTGPSGGSATPASPT